MKDEDAMSTIKVIVHNWPEDSVVTYMNNVEMTARGTAEHEAYNRMTCPLLWSKKVVPESGGKLFDRQWTITTLPAIAEVAKLHCVCPFNESGYGSGPIVVKSGGKVISLAPPMTIRSYAKKRGMCFHHFVSVTCSTVTIPNVSDADLNLKETHKTDVSFAEADVSAWKLLPPYTDFEKYMKKVLPDYVRNARDNTMKSKDIPHVPKKTYNLVKSWKRKGIPPGVAKHAHWMNPRLSTQACGTIVPDKIRLQREERLRLRREKAEDLAEEKRIARYEKSEKYWFEPASLRRRNA
jgi:hypothetical protein